MTSDTYYGVSAHVCETIDGIMKTQNQFLQLYTKYYIEREYEQIDLFRLLRQTYEISQVIYPGSYLQISPSFIFPDVVYIDADKRAQRVFQLDTAHDYICRRKDYQAPPPHRVLWPGLSPRDPSPCSIL